MDRNDCKPIEQVCEEWAHRGWVYDADADDCKRTDEALACEA